MAPISSASSPTTLLPSTAPLFSQHIGDGPSSPERARDQLGDSAPSYVSMLDLSASTARHLVLTTVDPGPAAAATFLPSGTGDNPSRRPDSLMADPADVGTTITGPRLGDGTLRAGGPGCNGGGTGVPWSIRSSWSPRHLMARRWKPASRASATGAVAGFNNGPRNRRHHVERGHTTTMPWRDGLWWARITARSCTGAQSNTAGEVCCSSPTPGHLRWLWTIPTPASPSPAAHSGAVDATPGWNYTWVALGWDQQAVTSMVPDGRRIRGRSHPPTRLKCGQVQLPSGFAFHQFRVRLPAIDKPGSYKHGQ